MDSLYYWLLCLLGAHRMLEDNDPEKQRVLNLAVKAWDLVDTSDLESDAFFDSAARAVEFLEKEIPEEQKKVVVDLVGHTHIDTAWLWRLCHTHEKAARSFSTVNRLMDEYPDYIFLHTQPQQYDYIKHDYPEIFEHIRRRAAEGRWEPAGGMWVEADCNLISGESMVRQLQMCIRDRFSIAAISPSTSTAIAPIMPIIKNLLPVSFFIPSVSPACRPR